MINHTNFFKNSKIKRFLLLVVLLILYIYVSAISYTQAVCSDIADNVFRLHVIANSDSKEDQNLKYLVRDNIIDYIHTISQNASTKEEVIEIAKAHLYEIKQLALQTIHDNGYDYSVKISVGNFSFPTKTYGDITFPPGYYDALKVEIGKAKGQNWWCVMFPPLCFVDDQNGIIDEKTDKKLKEVLTEEEYDLIMAKNKSEVKNLEFKFKITEVFQNIF